MAVSRSIAVDSTKLISADSFMLSGSKDPAAETDFRNIADAFCNGLPLYFAAPQGGGKQPHATTLLRLWQETVLAENASLPEARPLPYSASDEKIWRSLSNVFSKFAFENAPRIGRWVKFQFSHKRWREIFWEGLNTKDQLDLSASFMMKLLRSRHPLSCLLADLSLNIDPRYEECRSLRGASKELVGLSYAFFAFVKGRYYVYRLPHGPMYRHHWMRTEAMPADKRQEEIALAPAFPWGSLLVKTCKRGFSSDPDRMAIAFQGLRQYSTRQFPNLKRNSREQAQKQLEDFALTGLDTYCGWIPKKFRPGGLDFWIELASNPSLAMLLAIFLHVIGFEVPHLNPELAQHFLADAIVELGNYYVPFAATREYVAGTTAKKEFEIRLYFRSSIHKASGLDTLKGYDLTPLGPLKAYQKKLGKTSTQS
jgi:hypothetical protein